MVTEHRTNDGTAPIDTDWHTAVVDGLRVAYEVRGSGPLVIAHSGGPGADPASLRIPEVERTATAVSLDPVGTGRSDHIPDGDYSHATSARIAAALIRSLLGGRAVHLGHSHGGVVALQLAPDHPEVLDGVIVHDGQASHLDLVSRATARIDSFVRRFPGDPVATEVRAARDDAVAQEASDPASRSDSEVTSIARRLKPGGAWDVRPRLPDVHVPVSVFVGKHDFICGPISAAENWQDVPGAELVTFAASGHVAHHEEPEAFSEAVERFVSQVTAPNR